MRSEQNRTKQKNNKNKSKSKNKINQRIHGMQLSTPMAYDFHSFFMQNITCGAQQKNVSTNEFNCGRLCKDSEVIADTTIESNRNAGHFFPVKKKR